MREANVAEESENCGQRASLPPYYSSLIAGEARKSKMGSSTPG